jgi:arylsulfatase A-like enzyme
MASVVTGLPVGSHGAGRWSDVDGYTPIHSSRATLAARLDARGYDTAAVVAPNGMVERSFGFERGFATYVYALDLGRYALPKGVDRSGIARPVMTRIAQVLRLGGRRPTGDADWLADRAIHVIERRRDRPLFLWIHFLDTHLPYRHAEETCLPWSRKIALSAGPGKPEIVADPWWASDEGRAALRAAYRNEADHVDRAVSRLLDAIDRGGRETLVVFTADHGEEMFDHGDFEHGHALYQEVVSVPLVVAHPRDSRPPGTVEARVVGHVDIAPTILAAAGAPDAALPGQDLAKPIAEAAYLSENMLMDGPAEDRHAVRVGRWKAIFTRGEEALLFDLDADPGERSDAARARPDVVQGLASKQPVQEPGVREAAPMSPELEDALRALGYAVE